MSSLAPTRRRHLVRYRRRLDSQDRVWLRSGDIGVRMWAPEAGGWKEYIWQQDGPSTPSPNRTIWDAETSADIPVIGGPLPDVLRD